MNEDKENKGAGVKTPESKTPEVKVEEKKEAIVVVEHKNIYEALSAFQGECPSVPRNGEVEFTANGRKVQFKYATDDDTRRVINPFLAKHGLALRSEIVDGHNESILTHSTISFENVPTEVTKTFDGVTEKTVSTKRAVVDGEIRSGKLSISFKAGDYKDLGGAITYTRRYNNSQILGIPLGDDLDTQLMDATREKAEAFAFTVLKKGVESAELPELENKIAFLKKDLELAKDGKVPSTGLTVDQYNELIALGEKRLKGDNK